MYLGLDLGTSGATALLLDAGLAVVGRAARPIATAHPHPGWAEQDPAEVLGAVQAAGAEVLAARPPGAALIGAGFANPGESVLAWDARSGAPISPVVVWSDTRAGSVCERLRAEGLEDAITRLSGLRPDPYFCAAKFAWLLEHDQAVGAARRGGYLRLCTLDAWVAWHLSGEYVTDHSTASRTQLYDPRLGAWSPELLDLFDVPEAALPGIRPGQAALGTLRLGPHRVPWTAALLDQVAALLGNGCLDPGTVKVTYGTGAFVLAQAGPEVAAPPAGLLRTVGLSDSASRGFILDGGVYSAGSAVQWLQRLGVLAHASEASALAERATGPRLPFLPAFGGLGAPWWQPGARGVLGGLEAHSGPAEVTRAVLDGIASRVADVVEAMRPALPATPRLRADGGLAQNRYLIQRQADLCGLSVERSREHEATALGVALLAGVGAGTLTWADVRARTADVETIAPTLSEQERLRERDLWRRWLGQAAALPGA